MKQHEHKIACNPRAVAMRMASFRSLACTGSGSPALDTKCRIPFSVAMSQASDRAVMASLSFLSSSISCAGLIGGSGASLFLSLGSLPEAKKVIGSAWYAFKRRAGPPRVQQLTVFKSTSSLYKFTWGSGQAGGLSLPITTFFTYTALIIPM